MPPFLADRAQEHSPSTRMEVRAHASKIHGVLREIIDRGPYENDAFIHTGWKDRCVLGVETNKSLASERNDSLVLIAYFHHQQDEDSLDSQILLARAFRHSIYDSDGRELDLEQLGDLLAELQKLAGAEDGPRYVQPGELGQV